MVIRKEEELKKELEFLLKRIVKEDHQESIEVFERASVAIDALRDLKCPKKPPSSLSRRQKKEAASPPDHFLCPISKEIMNDPVLLASGQTFDRPFIQNWLNKGNRTCPNSKQVLSHTMLTPNHLVHRMISEWRESQNLQQPPPADDPEACSSIQAQQDHLNSLLERMLGLSFYDQKNAVKELRYLTKHIPSFRAMAGEALVVIPIFLSQFSLHQLDQDQELQGDVVTTILNISIHDDNKKIVGEDPSAINLLIQALKTGNMETRSNAAAALFTLSALDSNKYRIGESGAIRPLVDLLDEGNPVAKKDAASAIFNICIAHENKARAVRDGVVRVLLKNIVEETLLDESLAILAMLVSDREAMEEASANGGVPCLLRIIRESTCQRIKENSAVVLYSIYKMDRTELVEIMEEENSNGTISQLAKNGSSRARRKAAGILESLNQNRGIFSHFSV